MFWPDTCSLLDDSLFNHRLLQGHQQVTDAYLLSLCQVNDGCLVTFDRKLRPDVSVGGTPNLLKVLPLT